MHFYHLFNFCPFLSNTYASQPYNNTVIKFEHDFIACILQKRERAVADKKYEQSTVSWSWKLYCTERLRIFLSTVPSFVWKRIRREYIILDFRLKLENWGGYSSLSLIPILLLQTLPTNCRVDNSSNKQFQISGMSFNIVNSGFNNIESSIYLVRSGGMVDVTLNRTCAVKASAMQGCRNWGASSHTDFIQNHFLWKRMFYFLIITMNVVNQGFWGKKYASCTSQCFLIAAPAKHRKAKLLLRSLLFTSTPSLCVHFLPSWIPGHHKPRRPK